jgi:hypothetical protein
MQSEDGGYSDCPWKRSHGHPRPNSTSRETHKQPQRTRAPEAADWTEVEADLAEAEHAAAESTKAEKAAAENPETESDTEMTASGIAPPMTS